MNALFASQCRSVIWRLIAPPLLYLFAFVAMTFPLVLQFNTDYFTDRADGYQMIWDLWWVRYALLDLHQSPFHSSLLHFPNGASIWLHSLMPFIGLISIPLRAVLNDVQTFNVLVILAFVSAGTSAFWLCQGVLKQTWPSLACGFAYVFCSYRWAHYFGHLHLISTAVMPLYLLGSLSLLRRPRVGLAVGTSLLLLVSLLIDQYQFLDLALGTIVILLWWVGSGQWRGEALPPYLIPAIAFVITTIATCGPIVWFMWRATLDGAVLRTHNPDEWSADMLGPWVPDWTWIYNQWTRAVWGSQQYSYEEKSVCLGPVVAIAAIWALVRQRKPGRRSRYRLGSQWLFAILTLVFMLLSFGPTWRCWTIVVTRLTPYRVLTLLFPPIAFAGCTARMMIMAQLTACVLAAAALAQLRHVRGRFVRTTLIFLSVAGLVIESQPRTLFTCPPSVPRWVEMLRDDPRPGAVIDLIEGDDSMDLYFQSVHRRAIAQGNLSRVSQTTKLASAQVLDDVKNSQFRKLAKMGFAFLVTGAHSALLPLPLAYADRGARMYLLNAPDSDKSK